MNFPIQRTTLGQAPFTLKRATGQLDSRGSMWTNYTITGRLTAEVLLELVPGDGSNNLTTTAGCALLRDATPSCTQCWATAPAMKRACSGSRVPPPLLLALRAVPRSFLRGLREVGDL